MLPRCSCQVGAPHPQQMPACSRQYCRDPQSGSPMLHPVLPDAAIGCWEAVLHPQLPDQALHVTPYQKHNASNGHPFGQFLAVKLLDPGLSAVVAFLEKVISRCRPLEENQQRHRRRPRQAFMCLSRSHLTGYVARQSRHRRQRRLWSSSSSHLSCKPNRQR